MRRIVAGLAAIFCALLLAPQELAAAPAMPACCERMCPSHAGHHADPGPQVGSGKTCCPHDCCVAAGQRGTPLLMAAHVFMRGAALDGVSTPGVVRVPAKRAVETHLRGPPSLG